MSYTPVPAGGIEPPRDGATTRCLPTWLSRRMMVAEAGLEPAADEAYETPALPTELFRGVGIMWLPLLGSNQGLRVQSPVPYRLGEGATRLVPRAGFEPAPSDLKDRRPRPLDERGDVGAGSENRTRVICLEGSSSATELCPLGGWCRNRTCATHEVSAH